MAALADHCAATIPLDHIQRIEIYINESKQSLAAVKQATGADYLLNGTLYHLRTGRVVCHLKANGTVLASPPYQVLGYAWNQGPDIAWELLPSDKANYIACTPLIAGGKKLEHLDYDPAQGGRRGRSAIGRKQSRLALYCTRDGSDAARTPEQLQEDLFAAGWESAVMLDGGGSAQCDFAGSQVVSSRRVQHLLLVYLTEKSAEKEKAASPVKEGKHTVSDLS